MGLFRRLFKRPDVNNNIPSCQPEDENIIQMHIVPDSMLDCINVISDYAKIRALVRCGKRLLVSVANLPDLGEREKAINEHCITDAATLLKIDLSEIDINAWTSTNGLLNNSCNINVRAKISMIFMQILRLTREYENNNQEYGNLLLQTMSEFFDLSETIYVDATFDKMVTSFTADAQYMESKREESASLQMDQEKAKITMQNQLSSPEKNDAKNNNITDNQKQESCKCDICESLIARPEGYLCATEKVVSSPQYWRHYFTKAKSSFIQMGITTYEQFCSSLPARILINQTICINPNSWVICEKCIDLFPGERDNGAQHMKKWWESGRKYQHPNAGPAESSLKMVDFGPSSNIT